MQGSLDGRSLQSLSNMLQMKGFQRRVCFMFLSFITFSTSISGSVIASENSTSGLDNFQILSGNSNFAAKYEENESSNSDELLDTIDSIFNAIQQHRSAQDAHELWINMGEFLEDTAKRLYRLIFPRIIEISYDLGLSGSCMHSFLKLALDLRDLKLWAIKMIDSWGKIPPGTLEGTVSDFGNYDQCLSIVEDTDKREVLQSQYCMINILPPLPPLTSDMTLKSKVFNFTNTKLEGTVLEYVSTIIHGLYRRGGRFGTCLPKQCSKEDIQNVINLFAETFKFDIRIVNCEAKEEMKLNTLQIVVLVIISLLLFVVVFTTMIDLALKLKRKESDDNKIDNTEQNSKIMSILSTLSRPFSVIENTKGLLNTNTPPGSINCLCGMKVLSMFWLIFNHTYLTPLRTMYANSRYYMDVVGELWFQGIVNGWVPVDTFFFMGAFLFSYNSLKKTAKSGGRINYPRIIFNRLMRLCFPVWFLVLIVFLWPIIGSGPLWHEITDIQIRKCQRYWWATVFFFSNWMTADTLCLQQTWYLGADMQLFLAFLPMLTIIYKWPRVGIGLSFFVIIIGIVASGLNTFIPNIPPTPLYNILDSEVVDRLIEMTFLRTYLHMGPYAIGIIIGYMLYKKREVKISKYIVFAGWIVSSILCLASIWATQPWNSDHPIDPVSSILYSSLHKTAWTIGIAWITYTCATGNGSWANNFLSWKLFVILSRLSYMMYLSHFYVIWSRQGILRERPYFSHYTMICEFVGNSVFSIVLSYILYLMVEAPVSSLLKYHFGEVFKGAEIRIRKSKESSKDENVVSSRL